MKQQKRGLCYLCNYVIFVLLFVPGCHHQRDIIKKRTRIPVHSSRINTHLEIDIAKTKPPITIWIHGTRLFKSKAFQELFGKQPGLIAASEVDQNYGFSAIARTLAAHAPDRFPLKTFYIFGWSGKLKASAREQAAICLYQEIKKLIHTFETGYYYTPRIQIISHSHGGNVALNLPRVKHRNDPLVVNELVLLACPVQTRTMPLISDPMFTHVSSLYSSFDFIQVIAPELKKYHKAATGSLKFPPFSRRRFIPHPHLIQVKIKVDGRAIGHNEFVQQPFLQLLPSILETIEAWDAQLPATRRNKYKIKLLRIETARKHHSRRNEYVNPEPLLFD